MCVGVLPFCKNVPIISINVLAARKNRHISGIKYVRNVNYDMHCPWTSISLTVLSHPGSEYDEDFSPQDEFL